MRREQRNLKMVIRSHIFAATNLLCLGGVCAVFVWGGSLKAQATMVQSEAETRIDPDWSNVFSSSEGVNEGLDTNVMPFISLRANRKMVLLAKVKKKKKYRKKKSRSRLRRLTGEKTFRTGSGASTSIDFDAVDILGERKTPLGSLVTRSKASLEYDFVKIRLRWHPEMVQSATSLESGSGQ